MKNKQLNFKKALIIQFGSKYLNVFISLIITAILARILSPEEYGLLAIIMVFTTFFNTMADVGIGPAIIQFRNLNKKDYNALLFFSLLFGLFLAAVFTVCSIPIANFYSDNRLILLCRISAISIIFTTASSVPNGVLLKEKKFLTIAIGQIIASLTGGIVAILMATNGYGTYSLIANFIINSIIVFLYNCISTDIYPISIHFIEPLKKIFSYSAFNSLFTTVNYFARNLDNMLIGKFMNATNLGFYDKAYKLTTYPISYLAGIIGTVLQPYLAEYQDQKNYLYFVWKKISKAMSLIAAPISTILFCCASEIVLIIYGDKWGNSIPLLQALSVSLYFQIVDNAGGAMFQSANHTDYQFLQAIIFTTITIILLLFGLQTHSLFITACCISIAYSMQFLLITWFLVVKSLDGNGIEYLKQFIPEIIISLFTIFVIKFLIKLNISNIIVLFFIKVTVIGSIFLIFYKFSGQITVIKKIFHF